MKLQLEKRQRCIIHIDLDCFYCQIERNRLNLPDEIPLAVQQWNGLLAVNYPARDAGIKRHATVQEAKQLCPNLRLVHVPTYAQGDNEAKYHDNPSYQTHKTKFRKQALVCFFPLHSLLILNGLKNIMKDEAFLDVTKEVWDIIACEGIQGLGGNNKVPVINWEDAGVIPAEIENQEWTWDDYALYKAGILARAIRNDVKQELNYTCSAGIAHNKMLAKLCSAWNKPNNQTILPSGATLALLMNLPLKKIRMLGGKLGKEITTKLKVENTGELWMYSLEELEKKFGSSTGNWLYNIVRGVDDEPVETCSVNKSMTAAKRFRPPLSNIVNVENWLMVLSSEIYNRLMEAKCSQGRWPSTLHIYYASPNWDAPRRKSTSVPPSSIITTEGICHSMLVLVRNISSDFTPCSGLSITASFSSSKKGDVEMIKGQTHLTQFFKRNDDTSECQEEPIKGADHVMNMGEVKSEIEISAEEFDITNAESFFPDEEEHSPIKKSNLTIFEELPILESNHNATPMGHFCEECGITISRQDLEEHEDFHFAKSLQRQEREEIIQASLGNQSLSSGEAKSQKTRGKLKRKGRDSMEKGKKTPEKKSQCTLDMFYKK